MNPFGIEHIVKGASEDAAKLLKDGLKFKKPKAGVKPVGPGSKRGEMSQRAWESRIGKADDCAMCMRGRCDKHARRRKPRRGRFELVQTAGGSE